MYRCSGSVCFWASRIRILIRSVGQRYGFDPHPDPYQNVTDPQHSFLLLLTSYCCWYPSSCRRPLCCFRKRCSCCLFISTLLLRVFLLHCLLLAPSSAVADPIVANAPAFAGVPTIAGFPMLLLLPYFFWRPCWCSSLVLLEIPVMYMSHPIFDLIFIPSCVHIWIPEFLYKSSVYKIRMPTPTVFVSICCRSPP
jgi:hypothetical protein